MVEKSISKNLKKTRKYWAYYLLFLPAAASFIIFNYWPMGGIVLAFKDYFPRMGIYGSPFMDPFWEHFKTLFADRYFWTVVKNTLVISALHLIFGFPVPIMLAILFREVKNKHFAKFSQTVLYLPHFLSWIVMASMFITVFSSDGMVNNFLSVIGIGKINFLTSSYPFLSFLIMSSVWKSMGFGMIIYLAAMSGIDSALYEAAMVDGAGRWKRMWHITLPGISIAISIQLILALSGILNGGFDQIFNLYSTPVYDVADIIDTYLYRIGFGEQRMKNNIEIATALGLFKSVIAFALILVTNKAANKIGGGGIW